MGATGLGLLIEEHRSDIVATWRQRVQRDLGGSEPALAFAVAPLLREMTLALGGGGEGRHSREAWSRCAVLVRSTAPAAQLAREFKLLHRCVWEALRARDVPVSPSDRTVADEWLYDALAEALERLERVRTRVASFERAPVVIPPAVHPAPSGHPTAARGRTTPPPLPPRVRQPPVVVPARTAAVSELITDLEPLH